MNLKTMVAIIGVLIVALFGYNYYSSKKNAEKIAAIQAETAKAQAQLKQKEDEEKAIAQRQAAQANMAQMAAQQKAADNNAIDKEAKAKLEDVVKRWQDNLNLVSSTGRIALSPVVKDLQSLRREAEAIKTGDCTTPAKQHLVAAMEFSEKGTLAFMENAGGNGQFESEQYQRKAAPEIDEYKKAMANCKV